MRTGWLLESQAVLVQAERAAGGPPCLAAHRGHNVLGPTCASHPVANDQLGSRRLTGLPLAPKPSRTLEAVKSSYRGAGTDRLAHVSGYCMPVHPLPLGVNGSGGEEQAQPFGCPRGTRRPLVKILRREPLLGRTKRAPIRPKTP